MDHVGVVVSDLGGAIDFFSALGLERLGEMTVDGPEVSAINGLPEVESDIAMMGVPGGGGRIELCRYRSPRFDGGPVAAPAHAPGLRHLTFAVDDVEATLARLRPLGAEPVGELVRYGNSYRLCYVRGPEGIILELAEPLG
jgi:catechol 2,3-dioxygenase-like lactoylglutathione lyase family enzyme